MELMPPLPGTPRPYSGPRSTVCEVQKWMTIPVAEALVTKERHVRSDNKPSGDPAAALCEVFRWVTITVDEALRTGHRGRCVECKEPVRAHRGSVDGMAPHFEHLKRNPKCSRSDVR